jgi:hypothetical protein
LQEAVELYAHCGPQVPGMDPDWEKGIWDCHGLVNMNPIGDIEPCIVEEYEEYLVRRTDIGEILQESKKGSSISHTLTYGLLPERESWERFKGWLNAEDPRRYAEGWREKAAELNSQDRVLAFVGGSLYGSLRGWMGIENISLLMYDDPELFEEMVAFLADHFTKLMEPVLKLVTFDLVYFFEDCCGIDGPLFSPAIYSSVFHKYYKKIIDFYKKERGGPQ